MDPGFTQTYKEKSKELMRISEMCVEVKLKIWKAKIEKEAILAKMDKLAPSEGLYEEIKEKIERFRGSKLEIILLQLGQAFEKNKAYKHCLSALAKEKKEVLENYKEISSGLLSVNSLQGKLQSLQELIEEKENSSTYLKEKLIKVRNEHRKIRKKTDNGEIKSNLSLLEALKRQLELAKWDHQVLSVETTKIEQSISAETALTGLNIKETNLKLKQNIKNAKEKLLLTNQDICFKEKKINKLKTLLNNKHIKISKSEPVISPKSRNSVLSPASKFSERSSLIDLIKSGIDDKSSKLIAKTFQQIGTEPQSMTSKLIFLNREFD